MEFSAVSKELGHTTISVTSDMYGHLFEKASKRMATKAARLVPWAGKATTRKKGKPRRDQAA